MNDIHSFQINIPDETLAGIKNAVANYPWHEMPDDGGVAIRHKSQLHEGTLCLLGQRV